MKVIFEDGDNVNLAIYRLAEATYWVDVIDNYGHIDDDTDFLEKQCTRDALDHLEANGVEVFFGFGTKSPPTYPTKKPTYRIVENEDGLLAIEEIARVGLTMVFDDIGVELDMSDEELLKIRDYLETKLNGER